VTEAELTGEVEATAAAFEMPVERGKVREFARATMSSRPEYFDDPRTVCPVTFLVTTEFWAPPEGHAVGGAVQLDPERVLHGGQEFVFHGPPPRAGTTLVAQARVDRIYEKTGRRGGTMTFVEVVTDFKDEGGTLVAESRSIVIETGVAPPKDDSKGNE